MQNWSVFRLLLKSGRRGIFRLHTASSDDAAPQVPQEKTLHALRTLFSDTSLTLIGQNLKYDLMVLANYGLQSHNRLADTMLASYLLNPIQRHNLNALAQEHLR